MGPKMRKFRAPMKNNSCSTDTRVCSGLGPTEGWREQWASEGGSKHFSSVGSIVVYCFSIVVGYWCIAYITSGVH